MKTISKQATSDAELVKVLQDENSTSREKQKAFENIYSIHQRQLGNYFQKAVRDNDTADDLKMVTFQKIHSNINAYNPTLGVFSTWMYKIALNTLIDHKRKDKFEELSLDTLSTKTTDENEGMDFQLKCDSRTPEEEMIREQNIKAVRKAIASIDNDNIRKLMTYRYIQELNFKEIAELEGFDKDHSTLRVNIVRGQKILKEMLA